MYRTNSYIDKMYCSNCKCKNYRTNFTSGCGCGCGYNGYSCGQCGKTLFGKDTINVYTPKIPPKINYSYLNMIYPYDYPYVYYYGSYKNKLLNRY